MTKSDASSKYILLSLVHLMVEEPMDYGLVESAASKKGKSRQPPIQVEKVCSVLKSSSGTRTFAGCVAASTFHLRVFTDERF